MDLIVMDKEFNIMDYVDTYESFIWNEKFNEVGDFEYYNVYDPKIVYVFEHGMYIQNSYSDKAMIIDSIYKKDEDENGVHIIVKGESLESLLKRRIVWQKTVIDGDFQNGIKKLLMENVINPSEPKRRIDNFVFRESTDPAITNLKLRVQFTGDNLYEAISTLCKEKKIGFQVILDEQHRFVFSLYAGVDRSKPIVEGSPRPAVIFSPEYDNIATSDYSFSDREYKNVTLVAGEGEGLYTETSNNSGGSTVTIDGSSTRKFIIVGDASGLDRRELYTDARDISSDVDGTKLTDEQYNYLLKQRGMEKLTEHKVSYKIDSTIDPSVQYVFRKDFFLGDIVQTEDIFGNSKPVRISAMIMADNDSDGFSIYPTYEGLEEEGENI